MTEPLPTVRAWYDRLARIYDPLTDLAFRYRRHQAIRRLEVTEGLTVLDVACGTGLNFAAMEKRLGAAGTLIGVDYSEAMLDRARRKIAKRGWQNVHLVHADAAKLTHADLVAATGKPDLSIDREDDGSHRRRGLDAPVLGAAATGECLIRREGLLVLRGYAPHRRRGEGCGMTRNGLAA